MSKEETKTKKKKYKLQVMDIITISFTAIIVGIMGFVVYDHFADKKNDPSLTTQAPVTAAPTKEPTLSDIGNIYGNITNDANVVIIDDREYFISADDNGDKNIYVTSNNVTTPLIKTDASSLNVVTDYISFAGQLNTKGYYVFYINANGNICYVVDGPVGKDHEQKSSLTEVVFLSGSYSSINVSGEFLYHLNSDGVIGKTSIINKTTQDLTSERAYKNFVLYYGQIYAQGKDDNFIYSIPSVLQETSSATATAAATATGEAVNESKEKLIISDSVEAYALDNEWIYTAGENGIVRYLPDGLNQKDTLSREKANKINVYSNAIFYMVGNHLYTSSFESLLLDSIIDIGEVSSLTGINLSSSAIYLVNEDGKLCKSTYNSETKTYNEFKTMN